MYPLTATWIEYVNIFHSQRVHVKHLFEKAYIDFFMVWVENRVHVAAMLRLRLNDFSTQKQVLPTGLLPGTSAMISCLGLSLHCSSKSGGVLQKGWHLSAITFWMNRAA